MKIRSLHWVLIFLTAFIPSALAAERIAIGPLEAAKSEQNFSSISFEAPVTENGKLIAKAGPIFTTGGNYSGMVLPYLVSDPKPILYPRWAIKQGWQGRFVIAIEILTDGSVERFKVIESSGHRMLDNVATETVRSWKFHPAVKDGQLIATCIEIPVTFELEDS